MSETESDLACGVFLSESMHALKFDRKVDCVMKQKVRTDAGKDTAISRVNACCGSIPCVFLYLSSTSESGTLLPQANDIRTLSAITSGYFSLILVNCILGTQIMLQSDSRD